MIVISLDTAAINAKKIIGQIMKQFAKKEQLNYVTRFYLGSLKAAFLATVRSAVCPYRLTGKNPYHTPAAVNQSAKAVRLPI
mmetsp:Transcript_31369/g.46889  ORF Transcript_31369/g.46889 Transcript_31369/m.46889 type:complete len:82 (+) Transcript_31369:112-357(+)